MSHSLLTKLAWTENDENADSIATLSAGLSDEDGPADLAGTWPETLWNLLKGAVRQDGRFPRNMAGRRVLARCSFSAMRNWPAPA